MLYARPAFASIGVAKNENTPSVAWGVYCECRSAAPLPPILEHDRDDTWCEKRFFRFEPFYTESDQFTKTGSGQA
jgi:hypothetical protein